MGNGHMVMGTGHWALGNWNKQWGIDPKSTPNRPKMDPKPAPAPEECPGHDSGHVLGAPGAPRSLPGAPGGSQKDPQNRRPRENDGGRGNTRQAERYECVTFSPFSVSGPSGRHYGRPGVPQGTRFGSPGTPKMVLSLKLNVDFGIFDPESREIGLTS